MLSQDVIYCALTVVTTVMSNFGLYKAFDEKGIGYAKTAVGDKYVYEYMAKNGCRIGGEQSGHIIFSKYASTGDGILTSLKMMEVMLAKKKPMSELAAPLKIYPQVLENIRVTDKKAAQNDPAVQEAVSKVAEALGYTGRILWQSGKIAFIFSISIEMLQLFLRLGTFQLSDLFYNTVGGMIGGLMYYGITKAKKHL